MADFYSMEEAARVLGISLDELKQRIANGELRQAGEGGSPQFRKNEVDEYARRQGLGSDPDLQSDLSIDDLDFSDIFLGQGESDLGAPTVGIKKEEAEAAIKPALSSADQDLLGLASAAKPGESDVQVVKVNPLGASDSDVRVSPVSGKKGPSDSDVTLLSSESIELDLGDLTPMASGSRTGDTAERTMELGSSDEIPMVDSSSDFELSPSGVIDALQPESGSDFELAAIDSSSELDVPATQTASVADYKSGPSGSGVNLAKPNDTGIGLTDFDADSIELAPVDDAPPVKAPAPPPPAAAAKPAAGKPGDTGLAAAATSFDDTDFEIGELSESISQPIAGADQTVQLESASDFEIDQSDELSLISQQAVAVGSGARKAAATAKTPAEAEGDSSDSWEVGGGLPSADSENEVPAAVPAETKPAAKAAPALIRSGVSSEWGTPWVVALGFSTAMMLLLTMVAFDLVKNLYEFRGTTPVSSGLIKQVASILGGK
ncbi:MAG: helix-turn-helix domain-containing protein [Isosphaeraceae bacterium]